MKFVEIKTSPDRDHAVVLQGSGDVLTAEFALSSLFARTRGDGPEPSAESQGVREVARTLSAIDVQENPSAEHQLDGVAAETVVTALHDLAGMAHGPDSIQGHRIDDARRMLEKAYPAAPIGKHAPSTGRHAA